MSCCRRRRPAASAPAYAPDTSSGSEAHDPFRYDSSAAAIRRPPHAHYRSHGWPYSHGSSIEETLSVRHTTNANSGAPELELQLPKALRPESILFAFRRSRSSISLVDYAARQPTPIGAGSAALSGRVTPTGDASRSHRRKSTLLATPSSAKWFWGGKSQADSKAPIASDEVGEATSTSSDESKRVSYGVALASPEPALMRHKPAPSAQSSSLSEKRAVSQKLPSALHLDQDSRDAWNGIQNYHTQPRLDGPQALQPAFEQAPTPPQKAATNASTSAQPFVNISPPRQRRVTPRQAPPPIAIPAAGRRPADVARTAFPVMPGGLTDNDPCSPPTVHIARASQRRRMSSERSAASLALHPHDASSRARRFHYPSSLSPSQAEHPHRRGPPAAIQPPPFGVPAVSAWPPSPPLTLESRGDSHRTHSAEGDEGSPLPTPSRLRFRGAVNVPPPSTPPPTTPLPPPPPAVLAPLSTKSDLLANRKMGPQWPQEGAYRMVAKGGVSYPQLGSAENMGLEARPSR